MPKEKGESTEGRRSVSTLEIIENKSEVKGWNSNHRGANEWSRRVETKGKEEFSLIVCTRREESTVWSQNPHGEREKGATWSKGISEKKIIFQSETLGHVLTPFLWHVSI